MKKFLNSRALTNLLMFVFLIMFGRHIQIQSILAFNSAAGAFAVGAVHVQTLGAATLRRVPMNINLNN